MAITTNVKFRDKSLVNHVSKKVKVRSLEECFRKCLECFESNGRCICASINLQRTKHGSLAICEINDTAQEHKPCDFVDRNGYQYYALT